MEVTILAANARSLVDMGEARKDELSKTYPKDRRCSHPGCQTTLSISGLCT
ncbi:MAG: hypothetical protein M3355_11955 [Actinomycetota bacterium]|nr:hypothetical protein [Actinomycetota bacterium]